MIDGSRLAGALLPELDELVLKLYPTVTGDGIPLVTREFDRPDSSFINADLLKQVGGEAQLSGNCRNLAGQLKIAPGQSP